MTRPTILVTGATGKTGAALVAELRARDWPVRAAVHRLDARSDALRRLGAEPVVANMLDAAGMRAAMHGVSRAYWCPPFDPRVSEAAAIFAEAAQEARLEAVVGLSQWLASPDHPSALTRAVWQADKLLGAMPGITHIALEPGFFADNYLRLIGFAAQLGVLPSLTGDSLDAPPSTEDIARVAAALIMAPDGHTGRRYRPTGPALLSTRDMAAILSDVLGQRVRRVGMPMSLFLKAARLQQVPAFELAGFRHYVADHRRGAFALGAPSSVVQALIGRAPEDFATIARRYAARPEARRSLGLRLRAVADFLRTPLVPGQDLDALERGPSITASPTPRLSSDDPRWRAAHGDAAAARLLARAAVA
jgi:uncharacterized protein YbjT (DUF2867 family)